MKIYCWLINIYKYLVLLLYTTFFISCGSIFDGEGECNPKYIVKLKYDMNIKFADAFSNEINSISAYLFNENGEFIRRDDYMKNHLDSCNNSYILNMLPGKYKMVIFGNTIDNNAFSIPILSKDMHISSINCKLNRKSVKSDSLSVVDENFSPLFHCFINDITLPDKEGEHIVNASMVKNSNIIRVMLQNISGRTLNVDDFIFTIEGKNGYTNYDNSLIDDDLITYKPWNLSDGSAQMQNNKDSGTPINNVNVAIAEFTTNRLVCEENMHLTIRNKENNNVILSIPLIDYILLTKGSYRQKMSNQEYLDRQDEYNIMFFLDSKNGWINTRIIINGWAIVLNNSQLD